MAKAEEAPTIIFSMLGVSKVGALGQAAARGGGLDGSSVARIHV